VLLNVWNGSFFTVDRLLSARDTHQTEFHQYDLVT